MSTTPNLFCVIFRFGGTTNNLSLSVGLPETYEAGGGPIDPEDYIEYEDRQEVIRAMGRLMED